MEMPPADQQLEFLELVKDGVGQLTAALAVKWSPAQLRYVMKDPSFREAYQQMLTHQIEDVEKVVLDLAKRGNARMIELFLYNRSPDRWAPPTQKVKIDSTKKVEVAVVGTAVEAAKAIIAERGAIAALQAGVIEATASDDD